MILIFTLLFSLIPSVRRKLLSVLDVIDFSQDMPELLQLDFFERTQIEQVISNCEHVNEQGHTVCNVKVGFLSSFFIFGVFRHFHMCAFVFLFAVAAQSAGC